MDPIVCKTYDEIEFVKYRLRLGKMFAQNKSESCWRGPQDWSNSWRCLSTFLETCTGFKEAQDVRRSNGRHARTSSQHALCSTHYVTHDRRDSSEGQCSCCWRSFWHRLDRRCDVLSDCWWEWNCSVWIRVHELSCFRSWNQKLSSELHEEQVCWQSCSHSKRLPSVSAAYSSETGTTEEGSISPLQQLLLPHLLWCPLCLHPHHWYQWTCSHLSWSHREPWLPRWQNSWLVDVVSLLCVVVLVLLMVLFTNHVLVLFVTNYTIVTITL